MHIVIFTDFGKQSEAEQGSISFGFLFGPDRLGKVVISKNYMVIKYEIV